MDAHSQTLLCVTPIKHVRRCRHHVIDKHFLVYATLVASIVTRNRTSVVSKFPCHLCFCKGTLVTSRLPLPLVPNMVPLPFVTIRVPLPLVTVRVLLCPKGYTCELSSSTGAFLCDFPSSMGATFSLWPWIHRRVLGGFVRHRY